MSQEITVRGELTIQPPLNHREISILRGLTDKATQGRLDRDVYIAVQETEVDTEDGVLIWRTASKVKARPNNYASGLYKGLNQIAAALPDRTFGGYLECQDKGGDGEHWRIVVRNGIARDIYPELVWPDEPPERP